MPCTAVWLTERKHGSPEVCDGLHLLVSSIVGPRSLRLSPIRVVVSGLILSPLNSTLMFYPRKAGGAVHCVGITLFGILSTMAIRRPLYSATRRCAHNKMPGL